jgi:polyhydroxybutyrate depolymerase
MKRLLAVIIIVGASAFSARYHAAQAPGLRSLFDMAAAAATPEDGISRAPGSHKESMITADGRARSYVIHIPAGYTASRTYPLLLAFHGGYGSGAEMETFTGFDAKADAQGFIAVYPDSVSSHWNDGRGNTPAELEGVNDVSFIQQLIANLESQLPIDTTRIYATGISNGGMFTQLLGCELSNVLAAIGTDVGPIAAKVARQCHPGTIAVVGIQGAADPLVPIGGGVVKSSRLLGSGGTVQSAAATMGLWAKVDRCERAPAAISVPPTVGDGTSVVEYTYAGCTAGADVVYYVVQGMGHVWPPKAGTGGALSFITRLITGPTSGNINATDVMWDFFSRHARRQSAM